MVVLRRFGQESTMLLTNCRVNLRIKENIWRIVEVYLTRWNCDESFRYMEQGSNLEDPRVRSYALYAQCLHEDFRYIHDSNFFIELEVCDRGPKQGIAPRTGRGYDICTNLKHMF